MVILWRLYRKRHLRKLEAGVGGGWVGSGASCISRGIWVWISGTHVKAGCWAREEGGGGEQVPGALWTTHLAEMASSRFREKACLQKIKWRRIEENTRGQPVVSTQTCVWAHLALTNTRKEENKLEDQSTRPVLFRGIWVCSLQMKRVTPKHNVPKRQTTKLKGNILGVLGLGSRLHQEAEWF